MSDWHARLQRTQHLASTLAARGHDCYYFNPHLGRQYDKLYLLDPRPRAGELRAHLSELHVRLPTEPVYHHRLLAPRETERLADALQPLAGRHGTGVVQVVSFPTWGDAAMLLRERHGWPIVYDCHDLLEGFGNIARQIVDAEPAMLERADYVVFSSDYLRQAYEHRARLRPDRIALLRNAVDARFAPARTSGRPVAGYIGALQDWFDAEAVRAAATANPEALFRIVGRVEHQPARALASLPNIELAGEAPHDRLPEFLSGFTIGLIPFVVNELTRAANPIKMYEYFSAGLPVVSTRLPEVERYADLVYIADSADDFARQVTRALKEDDADLRKRRIELARGETWDRRADELVKIAQIILPGPDNPSVPAHRDRGPAKENR